MTMLPLKMFKKVCRFRMFSVSHPPIWPPVTCRGSCSPSVGLSPHPDELAGGWLQLDKTARPARLRPPRDHRCPKYQASIRTAQVHLNLWMLMFTAFHRKKKVTSQAGLPQIKAASAHVFQPNTKWLFQKPLSRQLVLLMRCTSNSQPLPDALQILQPEDFRWLMVVGSLQNHDRNWKPLDFCIFWMACSPPALSARCLPSPYPNLGSAHQLYPNLVVS